jgi:hypothetical protein
MLRVICGTTRKAALATLLVSALALAHGAAAADPAIDSTLIELNNVSREAYTAGRQALLSRTRPVIIVEFDDLLLLRDGKETRTPFTPPIYHALKSTSHLPLGIYGALAPAASGAGASPDWRGLLQAVREKAAAVVPRLEQMGFNDAQLRRQRKLLDESLGFIDRTLAAGTISDEELRSYARAVAALTLANAADAASAQVDGLHAAFEKLKRDLSSRELADLYVLILGPKTPRAGNLQYQYFANALGPDAAEKRVIYAEGIFDKDQALGLLGTLVIDRQVGQDFYSDAARMERDLLADGAQARLLQIFGRLGAD